MIRRAGTTDSNSSSTNLPGTTPATSINSIGISISNNSNNNSSSSSENAKQSNYLQDHHVSNNNKYNNDDDPKDRSISMSSMKRTWTTITGYMNSTRLMVLVVLCLQNSMFTILRRYSQGVLRETYSKHELLMVAEVIKILYSVWMIDKTVVSVANTNSKASPSSGDIESAPDNNGERISVGKDLTGHLLYLVKTSRKMMVLALIYGAMNILSFVSLRNISAGMFTIFAQTKILTTATFSTIMLKRQYSWTKWRALIGLMMGVLLFSEPIWGESQTTVRDGNPYVGITAVLIEVSLSGFASIYFEKVIKTDPMQLGIWERNFQLALGSLPVYMVFIVGEGGGVAGLFGGWSILAFLLAGLGAAGGLLVALSIKHGDSILKTLATTGAIVLTGLLDSLFLGGPLTPTMVIAAVMVIIAICNYTFDATVTTTTATVTVATPDSLSLSLSSPSPSSSNPKTTGRISIPKSQSNASMNGEETEKLLRRV